MTRLDPCQRGARQVPKGSQLADLLGETAVYPENSNLKLIDEGQRKSRTGSAAQRSDRARVECHKQAEPAFRPLMLFNVDPVAPLPVLLCGRCAPLGSVFVDPQRFTLNSTFMQSYIL